MAVRIPSFAQRGLNRGIGLGLIVLALFAFAAIVSYHSGDPSLNRAGAGAVHNLGGLPGAMLSDMSLQVFGLGSLLMVLTFLAWGWRMVTVGRIRWFGVRIVCFCLALALTSLLFSYLSPPAVWPFAAGFGGAMGMLLKQDMTMLLPAYASGLMAFVLLLFMLPMTLGLKRKEWRLFSLVLVRSGQFSMGMSRLVASSLKGDGEEAIERLKASRFKMPRLPFRRERLEEEWDEEGDFADDSPKLRGNLSEALAVAAQKAEKNGRSERKAPVEPRAVGQKQTSLNLAEIKGIYEMPSVSLLAKAPPKSKKHQLNESALQQNAKMLETTLNDFGVNGEITGIRPGPVVTLYELKPAPGTKSSRVIGLADDIARSMSAVSTRIAVIPGRDAIGIELPNQTRETVYLRELLEDEAFAKTQAKLPLVMGKDIGGEPIVVDLARMPHLLVAGTTGSGKSVSINTMILSLVYHLTPEQCRFIMIDPKMLELSIYNDIPHLLTPVVTEPAKAVVALKWAVKEMENRYRLMNNVNAKNLESFNKRLGEAKRTGTVLKREVQTGFDPETGKPIYESQEIDMTPLPFIVVVVDEMADLMLVAGKDIEGQIQRLAQMARAAGIHLITATQRPSVDVITGVIKANLPTRISFQVTSKIDSRTILGEQGAEQLLGQGDMLYMANGGRITRVHAPYCSEQEVEDVVAFLKTQGSPSYIESVTIDEDAETEAFDDGEETAEDRELYDRAVAVVVRDRKASTSYVQRCLKIGYNRAARLIEKMEREGVVGSANHVGKREVLVRNMDE